MSRLNTYTDGKESQIVSTNIESEQNLDDEEDITLAYISVNKKTNVELYAQGMYEDDSYKNCVAGTILEQNQT